MDEAAVKSQVLNEAFRILFLPGPAIEVARRIKSFEVAGRIVISLVVTRAR
jgi:hypothetical protein